MARSTGAFNRFLSFIGIVDDEPMQEENTSAERRTASSTTRDRRPTYTSGSSAGRASYTPRSFGSSTDEYRRRSADEYRRGTTASSSPSFDRTRRQAQTEDTDELEFRQRSAFSRPRQPQSVKPAANAAPARNGQRVQTDITEITSLEQCRDVITRLMDGNGILLNFEKMDDRLIQRAIDTLGGAAFALRASLKRVAERTYFIAPTSFDVEYTNRSDDGR